MRGKHWFRIHPQVLDYPTIEPGVLLFHDLDERPGNRAMRRPSTVDRCPTCEWPIEGISSTSWMGGGGPYRPPKYCGECGKPFPWTEAALSAAKEYADELDLNADEKEKLKSSIDDLTSDTSRTQLAASRFKKFMAKVTPEAGKALLQIVVSVATEEAKKKLMGL